MSNNLNLALQEEVKSYNNNILLVQEDIKNYQNVRLETLKTIEINDIADWERGDYGFYKNSDNEFTNVDINNSQTAWIQKTFNNVMQIDFDYRVSSEQSYDFFNIYINGTRVVRVSGGTNYSHFSKNFDLPTNVTVKFEYTKDVSGSLGQDAGFFKNLVLVQKIYTNGLKVSEIIKNIKNFNKNLKEDIKIYENIKNNIIHLIVPFKNIENVLQEKIKPFKNIVFFSYNRLGKQLNIPAKRIIIRNFEE